MCCLFGSICQKEGRVFDSKQAGVIKPRRTSTRAQQVHGSEIVHVLFSCSGSESDILFNLVNQHYSKGVDSYIVYNKEYVYARILFTNDQTK